MKKEECEMKDQMMLGQKEFMKAVLVILILMMTFVFLHVFVLKADAAEVLNGFMNPPSVEILDTIHLEALKTTTQGACIK
jgi:hypothetical protein